MKVKYGLVVLGLFVCVVCSNFSQCLAQGASSDAADQIGSLKKDFQDIQQRLDALDAKGNSLTSAASAPASLDAYGNHTGEGIHDIFIPLEGGNEYFVDESRHMEFSDKLGNSIFKIGGFVYAQYINFYGPSSQYLLNDINKTANENDGLEVRKVHLDFAGDFDKVWGMSFGVETDHSLPNTLGFYNAYLYAKLDKDLVIKAGKFTNVLSLEGLQANADSLLAESSMVLNLVPDKDLGVMLSGKVSHLFDYALEVANGTQDNVSSSETPIQPEQGLKAVTGRIFFTPFKKTKDPFEKEWLQGLGFGIGGSVDDESHVNQAYTADSQPWGTIQTSLGSNRFLEYMGGVYAQGAFYHWDPQFYYYNGSFGLEGEYVASIQTVGFDNEPSVQLTNTAWELQSSWVFGGKATYEGAVVDNPFDLSKGNLGALELAVRVDQLTADINSFTTNFPYNGGNGSLAVGPQVATALTLGVNWHLNRHFKWMFNWARTDFTGGNLAVNPEEIYVLRAAMIF
jgi:phosphate-selective porin OprO/OprP